MLLLRCRSCRYPIYVGWTGEGHERQPRFYDGQRAAEEDDLKACPGCGQALLVLEDLEAAEDEG